MTLEQTPTSADLRQVASGLVLGLVGLVVVVVVVISSSIIISLSCQIIMLVEALNELKLKEDPELA